MWKNDNTKTYARTLINMRAREGTGVGGGFKMFSGPPKDLGLGIGHQRSEEGRRSLGLKDLRTEVVTQLHSRGAPNGAGGFLMFI